MSLFFKQSTSNEMAVNLSSSGTGITGLTAGDVTCYISKNGGASAAYSLTGIITEVDSVNMPGIYSVTVSAAATDTLGELIMVFTPSTPGTFDQYAARITISTNLWDDLDTAITTSEGVVTAAITASEGNVTTAIGATETTLAADIAGVDSNVSSLGTNVSAVNAGLNDVQGVGFDTNTDSLAAQRAIFDTRVPAVVAQSDQLVGSGGTATAPVGVGLWDVLGDGTATLTSVDSSMARMLGLMHENFAILNQSYDTNNNLTSAIVRLYPSKTDTENDTNHFEEYTVSATYDTENRLTSYRIVREP